MSLFKSTRIVFNIARAATYSSRSCHMSTQVALVQYETQGNIAIISLCHPAARNAMDDHMTARLREVFDEFEADEAVRVGVLFGAGGSFSAGTNMKSTLPPPSSVQPNVKHFGKPMVCGIGGYCVGSGLELALMCDLRVVEEDACLGFFNRRYGVPLTDGACQRLPALVGLSRALDLILTGRAVGGKEALELGLANRLVATGTALGQAVTLAKSIAKYPQASLLYDREAAFKTAYGNIRFENATVSEAIRRETLQGVESFKLARGPAGKTTNIKRNEMADWEINEYHIEMKNQAK